MLMIWKQVNIFLPDSQTVIKEVGVPRWQAPLCSVKSHPGWEQKYKVNFSFPSWNSRHAWQLVLPLVWNHEHLAPSQFWGEKLLKEHFLFWCFSDMGRSRKWCKFYEKKYFVVIVTPNMKTAFKYLLTVWEAGAWFPATLIFHLSSWIRWEEIAKVGSAPIIFTTCYKMLWLSISKTSLIYIHRQISALKCGKWRNLLLPKQEEEDEFPNLWITHSSLGFFCTNFINQLINFS